MKLKRWKRYVLFSILPTLLLGAETELGKSLISVPVQLAPSLRASAPMPLPQPQLSPLPPKAEAFKFPPGVSFNKFNRTETISSIYYEFQ